MISNFNEDIHYSLIFVKVACSEKVVYTIVNNVTKFGVHGDKKRTGCPGKTSMKGDSLVKSTVPRIRIKKSENVSAEKVVDYV